jgi:hypothetical protein
MIGGETFSRSIVRAKKKETVLLVVVLSSICRTRVFFVLVARSFLRSDAMCILLACALRQHIARIPCATRQSVGIVAFSFLFLRFAAAGLPPARATTRLCFIGAKACRGRTVLPRKCDELPRRDDCADKWSLSFARWRRAAADDGLRNALFASSPAAGARNGPRAVPVRAATESERVGADDSSVQEGVKPARKTG